MSQSVKLVKIPFNRTHRIAAANSRSLEHPCKPLEIVETQGKGPMCRGGDIPLLKDIRRNGGREPLGWPERSNAYRDGACQLFVDAANKALDAASIGAAEVDTVVTISSTGIATPSLEARAAARVGFRADVERVPVFGLGCAGGVSGVSIASRLAQSRPGSVVLLVAVEICTIAFRLDLLTKANIVASALFGDGAAACVLRADEGGIAAVEMDGQHTWPDTLDVMGWNVDPQGLGVIFDRAIPPFVKEHIAPAIAGILGRAELGLGDVDRFACHPGGSKVLTELERAFLWNRGLSTTNAPSWPTMATCRLPLLCSSSSVSFNPAFQRGRC
jgi:alkylresorcinol/alkylpyrone synthase